MGIPEKPKSKYLGIRMDTQLHYKLGIISGYNRRSMNGQVLYLVRKAVEEFEKQHGKIEIHE